MFGRKSEAVNASHDGSGEQTIERERVVQTLPVADAAQIDPEIRRVAL